MDRQEAIEILEEVKVLDDSMYQFNPKYMKSLDMAIEALQTEQLKESQENFNKDFATESMLNADLISRQAVLEEIEKVCFSLRKKWRDFRLNQGSNGERDYLIKFIEQMPSVQPQKVVRCKDCKYAWKEDGYDNLWCNRLTGSFSVDRDGYCAWAKMKEGDAE